MSVLEIYQINEWEKHFESAKSKTYDQCSHAYVPNKQHGLGFTFILSQQDGAAILGIWYLIVEACSLQKKPRKGYLTDTGRIPDGHCDNPARPWTSKTMALRWRRSAEEIERALSVLCSEDVGWISVRRMKDTTRIPDGYHKDTIGSSDLDLDLDSKTTCASRESFQLGEETPNGNGNGKNTVHYMVLKFLIETLKLDQKHVGHVCGSIKGPGEWSCHKLGAVLYAFSQVKDNPTAAIKLARGCMTGNSASRADFDGQVNRADALLKSFRDQVAEGHDAL